MKVFHNYIKFLVAMILSIATISCQKEKEEIIDSEIKLSSSRLITKESDSFKFKIGYIIEGNAANEVLTALSDADWLTVISEQEYGEEDVTVAEETPTAQTRFIYLSLEENKSSAERRAKLSLSVKGAKNLTVVIVQKVNPAYRIDVNQSFTLNVTDVESSSVHIEVAPTNNDSYYYYGLVPAEKVKSYSSNEEFLKAYVQELRDYITAQSQKYGKEISYLDAGMLNKGFVSMNYKGLPALTEFYLIAFDLTLGGENSGKMSYKTFMTTARPASSSDFTIVVDERANVTVTPSADVRGQYVVDVYPLDTWNQLFTTPKALAEEWLSWVSGNGELSISSFAYTAPEVAKRCYYIQNAQSGNISTGDYVAFAFGTDGVKVTTGLAYCQFHFEE